MNFDKKIATDQEADSSLVSHLLMTQIGLLFSCDQTGDFSHPNSIRSEVEGGGL
jgi:hypothetical protein